MALTQAQQTALKADILSKAGPGGPFEVAMQVGSTGVIADWYNEQANPVVLAWKTSVSKLDIEDVMSWTVLIARSAGERDVYRILVGERGSVNPSKVNVRQAFIDIFSGAAGASMRATLTALFRTNASKIEAFFGGTVADGALERVYLGPIHFSDIAEALLKG